MGPEFLDKDKSRVILLEFEIWQTLRSLTLVSRSGSRSGSECLARCLPLELEGRQDDVASAYES